MARHLLLVIFEHRGGNAGKSAVVGKQWLVFDNGDSAITEVAEVNDENHVLYARALNDREA